jgi:hypothetical protein
MRAVRAILFAITLLAPALGGCAQPVMLQITTLQTAPASVGLRRTKGDGDPPIPQSCQTPCTASIAPNTTSEITLRAPGYYPAVLAVTYEEVRQAPNPATIVVPMQERPTIEERLRDLQRLRDQGRITPEEYEAKRKAILQEL